MFIFRGKKMMERERGREGEREGRERMRGDKEWGSEGMLGRLREACHLLMQPELCRR